MLLKVSRLQLSKVVSIETLKIIIYLNNRLTNLHTIYTLYLSRYLFSIIEGSA